MVISPLPQIMVAPNGATKTRATHPALPMTLPQLAQTARACQIAGAQGLHFHLRDASGGHLLDSGAYREALTQLKVHVPGMALQITTESAGLYSPPHQRHVALNSGARLVSAAVAEIARDDRLLARAFYRECAERGIAVQHILYNVEDADLLVEVLPATLLRADSLQLLFVLGRYAERQIAHPAMLDPFRVWMAHHQLQPDWAVCAFGRTERACLQAAYQHGGKCRVGFENSHVRPDGTPAVDNAAQVAALAACLRPRAHLQNCT